MKNFSLIVVFALILELFFVYGAPQKAFAKEAAVAEDYVLCELPFGNPNDPPIYPIACMPFTLRACGLFLDCCYCLGPNLNPLYRDCEPVPPTTVLPAEDWPIEIPGWPEEPCF